MHSLQRSIKRVAYRGLSRKLGEMLVQNSLAMHPILNFVGIICLIHEEKGTKIL